MGEEPGNVGAVEELRGDIEQTRAEVGETAAALGAKADVKGRAKERLHEVKENVASKTPDSAGGAANQATATVKDHPVPTAAIAAFAAGLAIGWLLAR